MHMLGGPGVAFVCKGFAGLSLAVCLLRSSLPLHSHVPAAPLAGVYANKLALFGMAIEVFFESCNPLLHVREGRSAQLNERLPVMLRPPKFAPETTLHMQWHQLCSLAAPPRPPLSSPKCSIGLPALSCCRCWAA